MTERGLVRPRAAAEALTGRDEAAVLLRLAEPATWSDQATPVLERFHLANVIADRAYLRIPPEDREQVRSQFDGLTRRV